MSVSQDKINKYFGMTLFYTVSGRSIIIILYYIDEILTVFNKMYPSNRGTESSAAPKNLFKVDKDCVNIGPYKAKGFHNLEAKTMYTTKKAIPDTCISVTLFTTRVRETYTDD